MENDHGFLIPYEVLLLCYQAEQARALSALLPQLLVRALLGKEPASEYACFDEGCRSDETRKEWAEIFKRLCYALDLEPENVLRRMYEKKSQEHFPPEDKEETITAILNGRPYTLNVGCAFTSSNMINAAIRAAAEQISKDGKLFKHGSIMNLVGDPPARPKHR